MKQDLSFELYKKYFDLKNKKVEISMKDKSVFNGVLVGYYKGDVDDGEPYIIKWHLIDEKEKSLTGTDSFGYSIGKIINQRDIKEIRFDADGSIMKF